MASILSFSYQNGDFNSGLISNPVEKTTTTLDQASNLLPPGAYTTFRTYQKSYTLRLSEHLARLEDSAKVAGLPIRLDTDQLRHNLRAALKQFPGTEARVRLTIPFGLGNETIYIFIGALSVPTPAQRTNGVKTITSILHRDNPSAKLSYFIQSSQDVRRQLLDGYEEVLMVDEKGSLLEGLTSNFYAVRDRELWTAGEGMLSGITRRMVLQLAREAGILIKLEAPKLADFSSFTEAFITSTSRAVLPVTEINHEPVGDGKPGPITRALMDLYDQKVLSEIELI